MVPYRAMLDAPHEVVEHVSWLIYARRCELNSRWRKLGCFRQALLVLVHLRKNETLAQAAAGFGVSTATAGRYVSETVDLLAERAPSPHELPPEGFVILDGTLITTNRIAADEPYYSTKHRRPGCQCDRPHHLAPPPRPARALPAVQPRPRPAACPGRTRLRSTQDVAATAASPLFHPPHRHSRPSRPCPADLHIFRMKTVHRG